MHKEDWYFFASMALAILAILGMDWRLVWGRVVRRPSKAKYFAVLVALIASFITSMLGLRQVYALEVFRPVDKTNLKLVYGKEFQNERIELDGRYFEHCKFNHVTLILRGRSNFVLRDNVFSGDLWIDAANGPASQIIVLMKAMDLINKNIPVKDHLPDAPTELRPN